jgi:NAD(P)H dehydrogenase (quinone)
VTGATGRQGGTGRSAAAYLLKRGRSVRALVRSIDKRAEALRDLGIEIVVGDYSNYPSLVGALNGVESAYFCYPVAEGIAEAAGLFAGAGREQGLKRIVDLSLATTRVDSPSPQGRAQWVAEQIFEWAGFCGVHLRIAAFFMENVPLLDGNNIRRSGRIANSFGDKALSWISGEDVGAMVAELLINDVHASDRILIAGGVERLSYSDIAKTISVAVGKRVRYNELTPEEWRYELTAAAKAKSGEVNARGIDHLVAQSVALRTGPALLSPSTFAFSPGRTRLPLRHSHSGIERNSRLAHRIERRNDEARKTNHVQHKSIYSPASWSNSAPESDRHGPSNADACRRCKCANRAER